MPANSAQPELNRSEWLVMNEIWTHEECSVRQVHEALARKKDWAYNTVRTITDRLQDKGFLESRKRGNTLLYKPTISRRKMTRNAIRNFIDRVFEGAAGPLVLHLLAQENLDKEELQKLEELISQKKEAANDAELD